MMVIMISNKLTDKREERKFYYKALDSIAGASWHMFVLYIRM